jgi:2,5-dichlorohydroquinone reductive dechlorinase
MLASVHSLTAGLITAFGSSGEIIGPDRSAPPRLELFHAANSICSQKVRVVMAQLEMTYLSHTMNIFAGHTYLPNYVRLRLMGCERSGVPLVAEHTGSTSMSSGGCDPAVVPTLIDRQTDEVIVDSKRICLYLDELVPNSRKLRPPMLQVAIDAELAIVDGLPNYQMLTGSPVGTDLRPQRLRDNDGIKFSMSKVHRCDRYLQEMSPDDELVQAYQAKRKKELDAAQHLFSDEAMHVAYAKATSACVLLESKLNTGKTAWLMGKSVTMADLFWAVELLRMNNLGANQLWENDKLPAVTKYVATAQQLPSVQSAVLTWPDALF